MIDLDADADGCTLMVFVAGEPALLLSRDELAWREAVREAVAAKVFGGLTCVRRLVVRRGGNRFELDNLVDPVLTAVGARPSDHTSLWATVDAGSEPGVEIAEQRPLSPPGSAVAVKLESAPQRSVRTTERLAELVEHAPLVGDEPCGCFLTLGRDTAGVVFGFEGPIKPTIDALWPHLGGAAHSPADHRIRDLRVSRDESQTGALVALWPMEDR